MTQPSTFEELDNGIYKAIWYSNESDEMERYVKWFIDKIKPLPPDPLVRVLHDYSHIGTPSFNRLRQVMSQYTLRDDVKLRIAHIYSDSLYPVIMNNVTLVTGVDGNRKYFRPSEEADAIKWLLDN